jgi:glycosyltransferase involved in cell wall biosynthesis
MPIENQILPSAEITDESHPQHLSLGSSSSGLLPSTLSVIIRFHNRERLPFLDEALFSLALQYWRDLEIVVSVQNGTENLVEDIRALLQSQPWAITPQCNIISLAVPEGTDARSALLNRGIAEARGRYLAFLDDDDLIYQHGYTTLIQQLKSSGRAVAVGGSRVAHSRREGGNWFVTAKGDPFAWGKTRLDLVRDNFVPIHSYVIDRERVSASDLHFDESFALLEDYEFLLRLCAQYQFDFACRNVPVCEYRIRDDGSNSMPSTPDIPSEAHLALERARAAIEEKKKKLRLVFSPEEIREIISQFEQEMEKQRSILEAERSVYRNSTAYKVAWQLNKILSRHPRLERLTSKIFTGAWNGLKVVRSKLFRAGGETKVLT